MAGPFKMKGFSGYGNESALKQNWSKEFQALTLEEKKAVLKDTKSHKKFERNMAEGAAKAHGTKPVYSKHKPLGDVDSHGMKNYRRLGYAGDSDLDNKSYVRHLKRDKKK